MTISGSFVIKWSSVTALTASAGETGYGDERPAGSSTDNRREQLLGSLEARVDGSIDSAQTWLDVLMAGS